MLLTFLLIVPLIGVFTLYGRIFYLLSNLDVICIISRKLACNGFSLIIAVLNILQIINNIFNKTHTAIEWYNKICDLREILRTSYLDFVFAIYPFIWLSILYTGDSHIIFSFVAWSLSILGLIYITYIDLSFNDKHPILYYFLVFIFIIIIIYTSWVFIAFLFLKIKFLLANIFKMDPWYNSGNGGPSNSGGPHNPNSSGGGPSGPRGPDGDAYLGSDDEAKKRRKERDKNYYNRRKNDPDFKRGKREYKKRVFEKNRREERFENDEKFKQEMLLDKQIDEKTDPVAEANYAKNTFELYFPSDLFVHDKIIQERIEEKNAKNTFELYFDKDWLKKNK